MLGPGGILNTYFILTIKLPEYGFMSFPTWLNNILKKWTRCCFEGSSCRKQDFFSSDTYLGLELFQWTDSSVAAPHAHTAAARMSGSAAPRLRALLRIMKGGGRCVSARGRRVQVRTAYLRTNPPSYRRRDSSSRAGWKSFMRGCARLSADLMRSFISRSWKGAGFSIGQFNPIKSLGRTVCKTSDIVKNTHFYSSFL